MQCTVPPVPVATSARVILSVSPTSLAAAFAQIPDPRRQASVTYSLASMLTLAVAAILANHRSVLAIAEWGQRQRPELLEQLGFAQGHTPCQSTFHRLFASLDGAAVSFTLGTHFATTAVPCDLDEPRGVAIDGKAQRGRLQYASGGCPVHALTAFCHDQGVVLAHEPIAAGADKAEAELTVAPALLARIDWSGRVLTGDALFCQRTLCQQVLEAGGDYLLAVRANQPTLHAAIALLFDPPADHAPLPLHDRRDLRTIERGHGRYDEQRHLVASTDLTDYLREQLGWPGIAQVFRLERTWREHGRSSQQLQYGITSLSPTSGPPARLLALKRGHWRIENGLHRGKDVALGEDASLIHVGQGPTVMALLREAALSLLHRAHVRHITARLREHSQHPDRAVALVIGPPPTHA